jgi:3-isopropylmalate/(R)-2-methylmalate dehydratase small subunit
MEAFVVLESTAAPLDKTNVDTDMIIPARHLKTIKRTGLGKFAFDELRYREDGSLKDFVLNNAPFNESCILIAGENFGCGSSSEHAPWALLDFGFRCVIAPSFAEIFFNNCFKNGMLPIVLDEVTVKKLMNDAAKEKKMKIDLEAQEIVIGTGEETISFDVDPFRKHCLLNGLDEISLTELKEEKIAAYEKLQRQKFPWLSLKDTLDAKQSN